MATANAVATLGILETRSIARGIQAADAMVKAAEVTLLRCRTTCPGKYLVFITGEVSAVESAIDAGCACCGPSLVGQAVFARIDARVVEALTGRRNAESPNAAGVVECRDVESAVRAADAAVKAAEVELLALRLGGGIGGKGYFVLVGDVSAVTAAVETGASVAQDHDMLVDSVVIPRPADSVFERLL